MATNSRRTTYVRNTMPEYQYGSAAHARAVARQLEEPAPKGHSKNVVRNRQKATYMNLGYVLFLAVMFSVFAITLITYVNLRAELTTRTKNLATLESQLNALTQENDEAMLLIETSVDLEEIKQIAIGELGMTYAQEGQIITYSATTTDYMRKVTADD